MTWEKEAFNYLRAFVASTATCDVLVSSFMHNLQIICVFFFFFKNQQGLITVVSSTTSGCFCESL